MTFLDADVVRVLEQAMPARFGGGPTDYQLLEQEADDGSPCLRLLVHPAVGPLNPAAVADALLAAIGPGSGAHRLMALDWRESRLLRVERRARWQPRPVRSCTFNIRRGPRLRRVPDEVAPFEAPDALRRAPSAATDLGKPGQAAQ
jgi:hypothetical protein